MSRHSAPSLPTPKPSGRPSAPRWLLWLLMLLAPILLLAGAECALRIAGYGGPAGPVVVKSVNGKEYYALNRSIGKRYFHQRGIAIPEAVDDDLFEIHKPPRTKRIFMLGESTMAGYPYDYNATAPSLLRDRLAMAYPGWHFEIVNAGLSAIGSYVVLDLMRDLGDYEPDAYVVYLGHNEFYGAYGVASTERSPGGWLLGLSLRLNRLRLALALRDGIAWIHDRFSPAPTPREGTLMEAMVRQQTVLYGSPEYAEARARFAENLDAIIRTAREQGASIVVSTMASNLRDQPPLLPAHGEGTGDSLRSLWERAYEQGESHLRAGEFAAAAAHFSEAIRLDTMDALAHYALARSLDTLGRYGEALAEYGRARDDDALRFRASGDFNALIRLTAAAGHARLADAESAFAAASPHGITGASLMLEHLHPNVQGYFLLAKLFAREVAAAFSLPPSPDLPDSAVYAAAQITPFTLDAARYRISILTQSWPFVPADRTESRDRYEPADAADSLAVLYVRKQLPWSEGHYGAADAAARAGRFDEAARDYLAVGKVAWYDYYPFMMAGDMRRLKGDSTAAESCYARALAVKDSPFVHVRLGMLYLDRGNLPASIAAFERVFAGAPDGMSARQRSMARTYLGAAYGRSGDLTKAKDNLRLALDIDPGNDGARQLLSKLP